MSEMLTHANQLHSLTSGKGLYSNDFSVILFIFHFSFFSLLKGLCYVLIMIFHDVSEFQPLKEKGIKR